MKGSNRDRLWSEEPALLENEGTKNAAEDKAYLQTALKQQKLYNSNGKFRVVITKD